MYGVMNDSSEWLCDDQGWILRFESQDDAILEINRMELEDQDNYSVEEIYD